MPTPGQPEASAPRIADDPPELPKGPAWLAAEACGIDRSQVAHALRQTVWERIQEHRSALSFALTLQQACHEQWDESAAPR